MPTTRQEIAEWFEEGVKNSKTHMIVVCDTFDYDDYPVFVSEGESARTAYEERDGRNMQRVMEVYNLRMDMETQLNERRAFNF